MNSSAPGTGAVLVTDHVRLALRIASLWTRRLPTSMGDDIRSNALLGLVEAGRRFEEGDFAMYASPRIRGAILDGLLSGSTVPLPRRARKAGITLQVVPFDDRAAASPPLNPALLDVAHLRDAFERLPRREAEILYLLYWDDLTLDGAGQVLGVSESRVCQVRARALRRLRRWMDVRRRR